MTIIRIPPQTLLMTTKHDMPIWIMSPPNPIETVAESAVGDKDWRFNVNERVFFVAKNDVQVVKAN